MRPWGLLILMWGLVVFSSEVLAVACYSKDHGGVFGGRGPGGASQYFLDSSVSVPDNAPEGQVIWRGHSTVVDVTCYKDATNYPELRTLSENIYFYPGTSESQAIPSIPGIKVGFVYNNTAYYGSNTVRLDGIHLRGCYNNESNKKCESATSTTVKLEYYPIIVKGPGTFTGYSQPVGIFQLDGEMGYNVAYANFYTVIQNMDALKPTRCTVELGLDGNQVNYGRVTTDRVSRGITQPLQINLTNTEYASGDCPSVKVRGVFQNIRDHTNNEYVPLYNRSGERIEGIGIKLSDDQSNPVTLNEPIGQGFEVVGPRDVQRYQATLYSTDSTPVQPGPFEGLLVYSISYL
ncbi:fimbrial protein [Vibrio sp. WXL103]|uniref:fimbrial protein n=1 Tax=Vibrio sp. WXL103 TaxID=3450710 RepID=UPI003EC895A2